MQAKHPVSCVVDGLFIPFVLNKVVLGDIKDLAGVSIRTGKRDISNPPTQGPWTNEIVYQDSVIKHAEQLVHEGNPQDAIILTLKDGRTFALYVGMFNMLQLQEQNGDPKYYYISLSINTHKIDIR